MADIKQFVDDILNAKYGEEVRNSIVNALNKVNNDNNKYINIKTEVVNSKDIIQKFMLAFDTKVNDAESLKIQLQTDINTGVDVKRDLEKATNTANAVKTEVDTAVKTANTTKQTLDTSVKSANGLVNSITVAKNEADQTKKNLDLSITSAGTTKTALEGAITNATTSKDNLVKVINAADTSSANLKKTTETASTVKGDLDTAVSNANTKKTELEKTIQDITLVTDTANKTKNNLAETIASASTVKGDLDLLTKTASELIITISGKNSLAQDLIVTLENKISTANDTGQGLQTIIDSATTAIGNLTTLIDSANTVKTALDASNENAAKTLAGLESENLSATLNIKDLRSENFNCQEILTGVTDIRAYLGMLDAIDIVGLSVDYQNKSFERLASAKGLTQGADFDKFTMYGGRKRCTVQDDGTITSWYGDPNYVEDGSIGQVMVYQPKFYYMVCPVVYDPIETGIGYNLRKANYYVSENPHNGFRVHPAFFDANGKEVDYILQSAYEGSVYDTSANAYLKEDEQVGDFTTLSGDKLCSISGVRPASGYTQSLTRPNVETIAQNRGKQWHGDLIKIESAEQLLMIIEAGTMNTQTAYGQGVTQKASGSGNESEKTGQTSTLGNATGIAEGKDGLVSITWRGKENPYGNIYKFVYGVNIFGDGKMNGGQPYICNDFNFAESKNSGNYEPAGFTLTNKNGYVSAMGYSTHHDWLFMASETDGNSSLPVGDYHYITPDLNSYRIARLGGYWGNWGNAGAFYWYLNYGVGSRIRYFGARLMYVPEFNSPEYTAAIQSWKSKL